MAGSLAGIEVKVNTVAGADTCGGVHVIVRRGRYFWCPGCRRTAGEIRAAGATWEDGKLVERAEARDGR